MNNELSPFPPPPPGAERPKQEAKPVDVFEFPTIDGEYVRAEDYDALLSQVASLRRQVEEAKREAFEAAAKLADSAGEYPYGDGSYKVACKTIAKAIRALAAGTGEEGK